MDDCLSRQLVSRMVGVSSETVHVVRVSFSGVNTGAAEIVGETEKA